MNNNKQKKPLFLRLSLKDRILFFKRLATLIKSGMPLLTALSMLKKQTKSKAQKLILNSISEDVENGQYLATSLGKFRKVFGELAINIVEVGEISGTLGENLDYLAEELKKYQT